MNGKALFLDRDGVINEDLNYVYRRSDFLFIEGIFDLCRAAVTSRFEVIVVTNQAGIARGYYSEAQFHELTAWMIAQFNENGVPIRKVYFCPFHPIEGIGEYRRDAECRKPKPGMILAARDECGLNLRDCILLGDKLTDIEAGQRAGVGTNVLLSSTPLQGVTTVPSLRAAIPLLSGATPK